MNNNKNVALITLFTPFCENIGGPSALPYFLLKYREDNIKVKVYTFNINNVLSSRIKDVERELNLEIILLKLPFWFKLVSNSKILSKIRFVLKYPLFSYIQLRNREITEINNDGNDLIWFYPHTFLKSSNRVLGNKVITGPDSASLHYYRVLKDSMTIINKSKSFAYYILYRKEIAIEKLETVDNKIHLVGLADYHFIKKVNPIANSFFLLHPHYQFVDKKIDFKSNKLKVLISGKLDIYTQSDSKELLNVFKLFKNDLNAKIELTYLGKGWAKIVKELQLNGFECNQIDWVENYTLEIVKHDIQIFPISVGTGTKGKVLDALTNGLLCIGSEYAFENICVRNNNSCLSYKNIENVPQILNAVYANRKKYQQIAENGRNQVKLYHNPCRISKRFFEIAIK